MDGVEPVTLTQDEVEVLKSLARSMGQPVPMSAELVEDEGFDARTRKIIREEIASLAGKALRRTQDQELSRSPDRNTMTEIANREAAQFWGEVLAEYSADG